MEGGTEFDLKAIDVDDETNKKTEPTTSSNKTPNNGWFSDILFVFFIIYEFIILPR